MSDYMRALCDRFCVCTAKVEKLEHTAEAYHDELTSVLAEEQCKALIHMEDALSQVRYERSLAAFTAGFKLADGLRRELGNDYSFDLDEELRARRIFLGSSDE